jgi:membrane-bound lytic murein transglycosylase D
MKLLGYERMLVPGAVLVLAAAALLLVLGLQREPLGVETPPMEAMLEEADGTEISRLEWDLPVTRNERVEFWIEFLAGRNKDKTRLWLERSARYVPMIRGELRARGMPEDLIYLAMIESGFSPRAYSHAHASGIWQFIAETGRRYGLEVSQHVDERRDPVKSTVAALDYLEALYRRFGSWYLAAAAYNSGENRVERILRERAGGRKGDDELFWRIAGYLPRETRDYVPLMLAAGHVAKEPEKYGFTDLEYHAPLRFETVLVPASTALRAIAGAAEVDESEIRDLNPHLLRPATPPGREFAVRVPAGQAELFAYNFERMPTEERLLAAVSTQISSSAAVHTVRRGETLSHISQRYGVSARLIQQANGVSNPRRIQVGQKLRIPEGGTVAVAAPAAATSWRTHTVRRGESLWTIARRHNVTVKQLQSWNNLGSRTAIRAGQRLQVRR